VPPDEFAYGGVTGWNPTAAQTVVATVGARPVRRDWQASLRERARALQRHGGNAKKCGDDVHDSCQRTDGNPHLNKGLLGYLLNGQTRLIAVVDERQSIVSRAVLRLLAHGAGDEPVLFVEGVYGDCRHRAAIMQMARQKAASLGLALTARSTAGAPAPDLTSLGGPAPFEYVDAAGGVMQGGCYTITGARYVDPASQQ
jgi:hypothetical protein